MASGDPVTARLVFRRAAEAGNAAAALALGATFDPAVLAKIGVRGMGADIEKARSWYEKAKEFGSPDPPRRLEMPANREGACPALDPAPLQTQAPGPGSGRARGTR